MYGYVRPFKPELKVKEFELYKAAYCGLCHALRAEYGILARFAVSYDMTFPILVASPKAELCKKTCPTRPFRKRPCASVGDVQRTVAALTVIFAWHKAEDARRDGGVLSKLGALCFRLFFRRKYKKAASRLPEFDGLCKTQMEKLVSLEKNGETSLDAVADCFASLLAGLSLLAEDGAAERIYKELFYHIGRAVYILDAADDFEADARKKRYNALTYAYGGALSDESKGQISETIEHSLAAAAAAFELLPSGDFSQIAANILYLGMPAAVGAVLSGELKRRKKRGPHHEPI